MPEPTKKTRTRDGDFKTFGPYGLVYCRYLLAQAQAAKKEGSTNLLDPNLYNYKTFAAENPAVWNQIIQDYPGKSEDDRPKRARENFIRAVDRFTRWLKTADGGYPKQFLTDAGLIESGLGGSCSDTPFSPGNDGYEEDAFDPEVGATFADEEDKKPAAKPTPPSPATDKDAPPSKTTDDYINELAEDVRKWSIKSSMGVNLKTFHVRDVPVKGEVFETNDVLAVQFRVTPGTVLETVAVVPDPTDTNAVDLSMDLDANISDADFRIKERWENNASYLALQMKRDLQRSCDNDKVEGERFERDKDRFYWPNGLKCSNKPVDPYKLGLRKRPTRAGNSLFEIDNMSLKHGKDDVAPCWLVTAFFFTQDCTGTVKQGGLKMNNSSDEEDFSPRSRGAKKRTKKAPIVEEDDEDYHDYDEVMEDNNDGGGGGGGKGRAGLIGTMLAVMSMGLMYR